MDNYCCKNYIIRRYEYYNSRSYQQVHIYETDSKKDAENMLKKYRKDAKPNQKYELIDNTYGM